MMRYREIASGFRVPVSSEEQAVIAMISQQGTPEADLTDERDQEVARSLLRRGLLNTGQDAQGNTMYYRNSISDLWRDRDS